MTSRMGLSLSQVQTRSADEPMTTFVLCNECGNRWKVCMSGSASLPCHPQMLSHIRSSILTAKKGPCALGGVGSIPACAEGVCRAGDHGRLFLVRQRDNARACFCFGRHPAGVGAAAHILSEDGQVCHFSTDEIVPLLP